MARAKPLLTAGQLVLLVACLASTVAPAQQIVVNKGLDVTRLEVANLRAIFGMRMLEWPDGTRVVPYVMTPDSDLHIQFVKGILQIFPYQLQQAWDRLIFSGTGQSPVVVSSPLEMRRRVAQTPGGIGYLPDGYLNDSVSPVEIIK